MAGLDGGTDILHHALRDIEHVEAKLLGAFVVPAVDPAMEILRTANTCDARTHMRRTHIASSLLAHRQHTGSTQAAHRQHSPQPETRLLRTCLTQTSNTSGTPPPHPPHTPVLKRLAAERALVDGGHAPELKQARRAVELLEPCSQIFQPNISCCQHMPWYFHLVVLAVGKSKPQCASKEAYPSS